MSEKTVTVHVNVPENTVELFNRQYKGCRSRFIRNAMKLANRDKDLFDKIFFCDLLSSHNVDNDFFKL